MMSTISPFVNPMRLFTVRALASLEPPQTQTEMREYRTALRTTLEAGGVEMAEVVDQPTASFSDGSRHALLVWYDVPCDALALFAPPLELIDAVTESALLLLNGCVMTNLASVPIEDVDAAARLMALMSVGADDARDLHARFIAPNRHRYDSDLTAPTVSDLEALWRRIFPFYVGGTNAPPNAIDVWITRAYAFGTGDVERTVYELGVNDETDRGAIPSCPP